jgi:nitrite reductase/ring-hydroxylating ferredoxin subunit
MSDESVSQEGWQKISVPLPSAGTTCPFTVGDRNLLLCNVNGEAYVVADKCSHANAPLARGRLSGHVLECPLHGGKLDVRDGKPVQNPIRKPVAVYPVRSRDGRFEISLQPSGLETNNA